VPGEVLEHRGEDRGIGQSIAQDIGGEPGQGEQAVGALLVRQNPAERRQRQGVGVPGMVGAGVASGGFVGSDCQRPR
jgi:hypothetical protein